MEMPAQGGHDKSSMKPSGHHREPQVARRKRAVLATFDHLVLLYDTWCFSTLVELSSLGKHLCGHGHL